MSGDSVAGNMLIQALMSPERYPHPVQQVELEQTHLSWVLLAGEYAYKIKKPVKLDFVDFSTLERRREDCFEELRLNRRFAPWLYLDVVAIRGSVDAPTIGGETDPIEYAVRMRRFAEEDELWSLVERDAITPQELDSFGRRVAEVHESSSVCERSSSAEPTMMVVMANARELQRLCEARGEDVTPLIEWTQQQWSRVSQIASRRCASDKVRECHGDLHARNVVRLNGELTAFDCIEFNPALRCLDVINDAAFLVMDLIARDRTQLAYAFLNGWLETSGDYQGVSLLRFFSVYRALVRARVALLANDERLAQRYIDAARVLASERRPMLMIMCGLSGSGKTWLSGKLITDVAAIRVRSDVERKRMAGLRAAESSRSLPGAGIYSLEFNERVYSQLLAHARTALEAGENVVVDAAFLKRSERAAFMSMARELGVSGAILYCVASMDELRRRLQSRQRTGHDASEADVAVMERQIGFWETFTEEERLAVLEIRTDDAESVDEAVRRLALCTPPPSPPPQAGEGKS